MKIATLFLTSALALTLTGCSSLVSLNPFVADGDAVMDRSLLGLWTSDDGKDAYWIRQDGTGYHIRYIDDSREEHQFAARLVSAGGIAILDLVTTVDDPFQIPVHMALRVWPEGSTLRFAFLQTDWLKDQAARSLSTAPAADRTLITAPGDAVRNFLLKVAADPRAWDKPEVLYRSQQ